MLVAPFTRQTVNINETLAFILSDFVTTLQKSNIHSCFSSVLVSSGFFTAILLGRECTAG